MKSGDRHSFASQPRGAGTSADALQFLDVAGGYGKKTIVQGLSLTVRQGEIMLLIGANGSGKSTILKIASGLLDVDCGALKLCGGDITHLDMHERVRNGLSFVMQGGQVFASLTARENLEMGLQLCPHGEKKARLDSVLDVLPALREQLSRRAGLLSGGQRQAPALGMVLAHRPRVLLLDEPTAGLSPGLAKEAMETLRALNENLGVTILLVEQRIAEGLGIAHRAAALSDGRVVGETQSPAEWLQEGELDRFFFDSQHAGHDL